MASSTTLPNSIKNFLAGKIKKISAVAIQLKTNKLHSTGNTLNTTINPIS